jgi:hypothetical protein
MVHDEEVVAPLVDAERLFGVLEGLWLPARVNNTASSVSLTILLESVFAVEGTYYVVTLAWVASWFSSMTALETWCATLAVPKAALMLATVCS